jgi:hypothetical protein
VRRHEAIRRTSIFRTPGYYVQFVPATEGTKPRRDAHPSFDQTWAKSRADR